MSNDATCLLESVLEYDKGRLGGGSMTCAIYDTAWISMIQKRTGSGSVWLFPTSFTFLCEAQSETGGWSCGSNNANSIIDTSAALLALCTRQRECVPDSKISKDLESRIRRAEVYLKQALRVLSADETDQVGFEIILPSLLDKLSTHGLEFSFDEKASLYRLRGAKLSRLDTKLFESPNAPQHSVLHSLEALSDVVDFDRLRHLKRFGSFMASPAATAASLIYGKQWDDESESYLTAVVEFGSGKESGAVPSAFPSQLFEISWVASTLISCGYSCAELGLDKAARTCQVLENALHTGGGVIGFAPGILPDADDTAKAILAVRLLGGNATAEHLLAKFEGAEHFRTYSYERNASVTTNCNVLVCLLSCNDQIASFTPAIRKTTEFLCQCWSRGPRGMTDKWNLSQYYPRMLLAQALSKFLATLSTLESDPDSNWDSIAAKARLVLFQILVSTLKDQASNGSWEQSIEATSYAIICIHHAYPEKSTYAVDAQIGFALFAASDFLQTTPSDAAPERLWIEKVTYGSSNLSKAYRLGAERILSNLLLQIGRQNPTTTQRWQNKGLKMAKSMYERLALVKPLPTWLLEASILEGTLFYPLLQQAAASIFPPHLGKPKHLDFVPFTWIATAHLGRAYPHLELQLGMMVLSVSFYIMDNYLEATVTNWSQDQRSKLRNRIEKALAECQEDPNAITDIALDEAIRCFISWLCGHSAVRRADPQIRARLIGSLRLYFAAHLQQAEDAIKTEPEPLSNGASTEQHTNGHGTNGTSKTTTEHHVNGNGTSKTVNTSQLHDTAWTKKYSSLYDWIHRVSGPHIGGSIATWFILCLSSTDPEARSAPIDSELGFYIVEELSQHFSAISRLYNDYGSARRDLREGNFSGLDLLGSSRADPEWMSSRDKLLQLASFEKKRIQRILAEDLPGTIPATSSQALEVLSSSVELYGQMYIVKDHSDIQS